MARIRLIAATSLPTLAAFSGALAAQEYCVACTEPAALYRCILEDAKPGAAPSLQVACISRIAKEGGHGQCTVKRGVTVFECDGIVKQTLPHRPPRRRSRRPMTNRRKRLPKWPNVRKPTASANGRRRAGSFRIRLPASPRYSQNVPPASISDKAITGCF